MIDVDPKITSVDIGFVQAGKLKYFGSIPIHGGKAVIETWFGNEACEFVLRAQGTSTLFFIENTARLLPQEDNSKPDVIFKKWFWQN